MTRRWIFPQLQGLPTAILLPPVFSVEAPVRCMNGECLARRATHITPRKAVQIARDVISMVAFRPWLGGHQEVTCPRGANE